MCFILNAMGQVALNRMNGQKCHFSRTDPFMTLSLSLTLSLIRVKGTHGRSAKLGIFPSQASVFRL